MKEKIKENAAQLLIEIDTGTDACRHYNDGFIDGVNYGIAETEKSFSLNLDKLWEQYRTQTNNEDAWMFKEWLKHNCFSY